MKPLLCLLMTLQLALSACDRTKYFTWEPETVAEREMRLSVSRLQSTVGEGSLFGAGIGAVLGGFFGQTEGAFQGAQLGRLGGVTAGAYLRQLQQQFSETEDVLAAMVTDTQATNAELEVAIANMRALLDERRSILQATQSAGDLTVQARAEARGNRNLGEMNLAVTSAEAKQSLFGDTRELILIETPTAETAALDSQIELIRNRINTMKQLSNTLAQAL